MTHVGALIVILLEVQCIKEKSSGGGGSLKIERRLVAKKRSSNGVPAAIATSGSACAMDGVSTSSPPVPIFNAARPKTTPIAVNGVAGSGRRDNGGSKNANKKRVGLKDFERIRRLGQKCFRKGHLGARKEDWRDVRNEDS